MEFESGNPAGPMPSMMPPLLKRRLQTRDAEVDEMIESAYLAFDRDEIVEAIYWFVLADLRGIRMYADEISACVTRWMALGCPCQDDGSEGTLTGEQHAFGWAALLWFSRVAPDFAVDWMTEAARNGNREARLFGAKFLGALMYRRAKERTLLAEGAYGPHAIMLLLIVLIVLLIVLVAVFSYVLTSVPYETWRTRSLISWVRP